MLFKSHKIENIFMGNCHVTIVLHDIFHVAYSSKVRFSIFRVILVGPGRWAYISCIARWEVAGSYAEGEAMSATNRDWPSPSSPWRNPHMQQTIRFYHRRHQNPLVTIKNEFLVWGSRDRQDSSTDCLLIMYPRDSAAIAKAAPVTLSG